jgi:tetratricopeptide (TPR) repeat protein
MTYIKAAITTVLALLILLGGYTYFTFDDKYSIQQAFDSYLKGEYAKAEEILEGVQDQNLEPHKLLYQAYVARERGDIKLSNEYIEKAVKLTRHDTRSKLRLEIYLNQAFNGYIDDDYSYMEKALEQINTQLGNEQNEWINFFKLIHLSNVNPSELSTDREENNYYWEGVKSKIPLSHWMKQSFFKRLTPFWQKENQIIYLINMGKFVEARQLIETELPKSNEGDRDQLYLLMARSYMKEAKTKPPVAATPYYKLAFSYYSKVPFHHDKFQKERNHFFEQSKEQIAILIENQKFGEIDFFVGVLDQFDDGPEKERLSGTFLSLIDNEKEEENWNNVYQLLSLLSKTLPENSARLNLNEKLENELLEAIEIGHMNSVNQSWKALLIMNPDNQELQQKYTQILTNRILGLLTDKNGSRTQGFELLKFWNGVERDFEKRKQFSEKLVKRASSLWQDPNEGNHANQLLVLSTQVIGNQNVEYIRELIKQELKKSYENLLATESYGSLPFIVKVPKNLGMSDFKLANQEEISGYIQEGQDAFGRRDFTKAQNLMNWVLTLSPNHKKALAIAGLVNYYQGHYKIAEEYLQKIDLDQPEIRQAFAVSQILSGVDPEEGMHTLEEMEREGVLTKNVYLRLGFGEVVNKQPKKVEKWLAKLNKNNDEVKIGYALASAESGNWQNVLNELSGLSPKYSRLDSIMSLELIAYLNLDDDAKAEKAFDRLMSEKYVPVASEFSQPFRILSNKILNDYTRLYTASLYFEDVGNYDEALRYLDDIIDPSPNVLLRKGEMLIDIKDYHRAKMELMNALDLVQFIPESEGIQAEILIKLAYASRQQQQNIDTYIFYRDYYEIEPDSLEYRAEYAESLIAVRRFDVAYEQYLFMKDREFFKDEYNLPLIETYIHLNKFSVADDLAEEWMSQKNSIDLLTSLKVAQLMVITQNENAIAFILQSLPSVDELKPLEVIELIRLFMYQGKFFQASSLMREKQQVLEETSEGLFGLAQFYLFYTDLNMAIEYAKKALDKDPHNIKIQRFIQNNQSETSLKLMVEKLKVEEGESLNRLTDFDSQLMLVESIIEKAIQKVMSQPGTSFHTIFELRAVLDSLIKLSEDLSDIPRVQLYMGQLYYLLENIEDAEEYFNKSVELDFSYSKAHQNFGLLYLSKMQLNSAKKELIEAIKYEPYNSDAWFLLGKVNEEKGALYDSIMAYNNAIRYKPNNPRPYLLMGKLQLEVNNPEGAMETLEKTLEISPDDIEVLKVLLLALYNPHLSFEGVHEDRILAQRTFIEEKLQKLAPEELQKILGQIKSSDKYEPIKRMTFPY